jgi:hypothetical protein
MRLDLGFSINSSRKRRSSGVSGPSARPCAARPGGLRGRDGGDHPRLMAAVIRDLVGRLSVLFVHDVDRGSPIVMGSLRGLPTIPGSGPRGPSCHDEEQTQRKSAGTIYLYGVHANADKKVSRCAIFFERGRAHFYSVKAAGVQQHRREQNSARFRSFASSSHVSIF